MMNIYESDEYYMPVMNIIYGCDDICDLCEYLRLLEKKKKKEKILRGEQKSLLSAKSPSSTRAKYLALDEGVAPTPNGGACRDGKRAFDESQGRLSAHVRREDPGKLSVKPASQVGLQRVAFAEWKRAFAERIPALGEDPESYSGSVATSTLDMR
jgi:hypothetical protein